MNCRHAQHLLDSYLDGELAASLRAEVHAHRLTCSDCQRAMVVVEVAGDVIGSDSPAPDLSLGFTDRVLEAMKPPQEPRVARIVRFRRAAAFLGPVLSAAAVWMIVVSVTRPVEPVPTSGSLGKGDVVVRPRVAAVTDVAVSPTGSVSIMDALAEGLLSPAMETWRDTRRSTRDLVALGRLALSVAGEPFGSPPQEDAEGVEAGVLLQAESMLMNILAPKSVDETVDEGPDVL